MSGYSETLVQHVQVHLLAVALESVEVALGRMEQAALDEI